MFTASTPQIGFRFGASVCLSARRRQELARKPGERTLLPRDTLPENVVPRRLVRPRGDASSVPGGRLASPGGGVDYPGGRVNATIAEPD